MTLATIFFCAIFSFYDYTITLILLAGSILLVICSSGSSFSGIFFTDSTSSILILLSLLVMTYCIFSSLLDYWNSNFHGGFSLMLGIMFLAILISFSCFSMVLFYFSFEFLFLLMYLFLLNWGYSPERLQASFYMIFYTIMVSFPFLIYIISMESMPFNTSFQMNQFWWPFYLIVFLVKLPVYGAHLWLPKAHVEAPISGSMLLAGILLKIGGYGLIRFSPLFLQKLSIYSNYLVSLGLLSGVISCFLCLRQSDLKAYVAYSSICHMGFGLAGLLTSNNFGYTGGLIMLIAHGFCSSCLFYILYVLYNRLYSRSMLTLKGLGISFPPISGLWFLFLAMNMGVPPFFSFFSEIMILSGSLGSNLMTFMTSSMILLAAGLYCLYLYVISFHGKGEMPTGSYSLETREYLNIYSHGFFLMSSAFMLPFML